VGSKVKPNPIVIVPGIMGSELLLHNATIWTADTRALQTIFNPSYLLHWLPVDVGGLLSIYDPLLQFLTATLGYGNADLFRFSYDWRRGVDAGAQELSRYVGNVVSPQNSGQVIFIAHSLGCLIVRIALSQGLIAQNKIKLVIAAGPPLFGSAAAFKAVVEMPRIQKHFDHLFELARKRWPNFAKRIEVSVVKSLMTVRSLLELMPPSAIPILSDTKQMFAALDWPGWPRSLVTFTNEVRQTQAKLRDPWPVGVQRQLVLSQEWPTDTGYLIDDHEPFAILASAATEPGDGRVLADSARVFGSDIPELFVRASHDELVCNREFFAYLPVIL
jgi:Lecithin:cholesterol acyltransferase